MRNAWYQEKDTKRDSQYDQDDSTKEKSRVFQGNVSFLQFIGMTITKNCFGVNYIL